MKRVSITRHSTETVTMLELLKSRKEQDGEWQNNPNVTRMFATITQV